jgi:hypothetical protein
LRSGGGKGQERPCGEQSSLMHCTFLRLETRMPTI